jgi:hypothetical protein
MPLVVMNSVVPSGAERTTSRPPMFGGREVPPWYPVSQVGHK